jgi:urease accessory protein UreF
MKPVTNIAAPAPAELLGDAHPLLEQLGSTEELALATAPASESLRVSHERVHDLPSLRNFLEFYRCEILVPLELPVIVAAHGHASRNELRELLALDQRIAGEKAIREFAQASCRVGQRQLSKLRALRDHRVIQRYLVAIENGDAHGWHTLVYGVSLGTFSLPLRQGLQNYAEHTMRGFIETAARRLRLQQAAVNTTIEEQSAHVPAGIEKAIQAQARLVAL